MISKGKKENYLREDSSVSCCYKNVDKVYFRRSDRTVTKYFTTSIFTERKPIKIGILNDVTEDSRNYIKYNVQQRKYRFPEIKKNLWFRTQYEYVKA